MSTLRLPALWLLLLLSTLGTGCTWFKKTPPPSPPPPPPPAPKIVIPPPQPVQAKPLEETRPSEGIGSAKDRWEILVGRPMPECEIRPRSGGDEI